MQEGKQTKKITIQRQIQYLDYLNDSVFQGVNRRFILSFKNEMIF